MLAIRTKAESDGRDYTPSGAPLQSPKGALFSRQVLPTTAANPGYGVKPAAAQTAAEYNRVGDQLLAVFQKKYGDPAKAFAAYQSGPGNLEKAIAKYGDNWRQGLGPQGRAYVAQNTAALGKGAPEKTMEDDESGTDSGQTTDGALSNAIETQGAVAPQTGLDFGKEYNATAAQLVELQRQKDELRQKQFEAGQAAIQKQRFGPTMSDRLFALSAAIATPHYAGQRGIGNIMADIGAPLGAVLRGNRDDQQQRAKALLDLQNQYATDTISDKQTAAKDRLSQLKTAATLARANGRAQPSMAYTDAQGITHHRVYGTRLIQPPVQAIQELRQHLADPTIPLAVKEATRQNFDKNFGFKASEVYEQ